MDKVFEYLYKEIKLKDNDTVVVGVSYGPDSMVLLNVLLEIRKEIPLNIVVAHINHNVRKESIEEQKLLKEYSEKYNLIFEDMIIKEYNNDNFHNEARNIRYDFFEKLVKKYKAKYLMTAHHGDDLIETILMRITRGSTLKGYSGFSVLVDKGTYKIVRPLIFVTKQEVLDYAKEKNIPFALDLSNNNDKYTRNRYRKYILPFLKEEDKSIHTKYLKFSKVLVENDEFINKIVKDSLDEVYIDGKLNIIKFKEKDQLIQKRIIEYMLNDIYMDDMILINDTHLELLMKLIHSNKANSYLILPNNIKVVKSYNDVFFTKDENTLFDYNILIEDTVFLPNGKKIVKIDKSDTDGNDICRLSSSDISLPLYVRTKKTGDKIEIKNGTGHTKIKDIFIDKKIPVTERNFWPVVVDSNDNIVWLPGLKKSKFNRLKTDKCDIILRYE